MPELSTSEAAQGAAIGEPQAGNPTGQAPEGSVTPPVTPAGQAAAPAVAATPAGSANEVQREAQALRKRLRDAEAKLQEQQNAGLSEQEKLARRVDELQGQLTERDQRLRSAEVRALAAGRNVVDSDAVERLLDWKRVDDGEPISRVFDDLVKARPWLLQGAPSLGPTNAGQQVGLTMDMLRGMSRDEITAYEREHPGSVDRLLTKR